MIPLKLIKEAAAVIAQPRTSTIKCCIEHCSYPASWKMGMVTPLFVALNIAAILLAGRWAW